MWYWIINIILVIWVLGDCRKRKISSLSWGIGTLIVGSIVIPFYLAKRPLLSGEAREGGTTWNVLKNFAILWTVVMIIAAVAGILNVSRSAGNIESPAGQTGAAIGTVLGLGMIGALWFFPFVGAIVLGLILKKSSIIEKGPSDPTVEISQVIVMPKKSVIVFKWIGGIFFGITAAIIIAQMTTNNSATNTSSAGTHSTRSTSLTLVSFDWARGEYGNTILIGTIKNNSGREYSYVQIEFNLYDKDGAQVGSTMTNINHLEAGGIWKFEAGVIEGSVTQAKVKGITGF